MKNFTLMRQYREEATTGALIDSGTGKKIICTLEPPNRSNAKDNPSTSENEAGCIPEGIYKVRRRDPKIFASAHFKDNWEILDVPHKEGVVFHSGNYWFESKSCILTGTEIIDMNPKNQPNFDKNKKWYASQSRDALKNFTNLMPSEFELKITSTATLCNV